MTLPATQESPSVGSVVGDVASDVTRLVRQEVELARAEIYAEASKAAKGARAIAMAAFAFGLVATVASVALAFALAEVLANSTPGIARWSTALGAGIVAVLWLFIGLVLLGIGRRRLRGLSLVPRQTIASLKEDIAWLRKPNA